MASKVVCISRSDQRYFFEGNGKGIQVGKVYEVIPHNSLRDITAGSYKIIDDFGNQEYYNKDLFITIEEYRKRRLDNLGI